METPIHEAAGAGDETRAAFEEIEREIGTVVDGLDEIAGNAAELSLGRRRER